MADGQRYKCCLQFTLINNRQAILLMNPNINKIKMNIAFSTNYLCTPHFETELELIQLHLEKGTRMRLDFITETIV